MRARRASGSDAAVRDHQPGGRAGPAPRRGHRAHTDGALQQAVDRARVDRALVRAGAAGTPTDSEVWTHSQGLYNLRRDLALAFDVHADVVRVRHADGAGCYGHNGADDVAFDAAWLAREAPGRAVRVQWSRADEFACTLRRCDGGRTRRRPRRRRRGVALAAAGLECGPQRAAPAATRRRRCSALADGTASGAEPPPLNTPLASGGGAERNACRATPCRRGTVRWHKVLTVPLRSSALRSLGCACQRVRGRDLRRRDRECDRRATRCRVAGASSTHDARAAPCSSSRPRVPAGRRARAADGVGHGLAFARYKSSGAWCAVVAEVEAGAALKVRRLTSRSMSAWWSIPTAWRRRSRVVRSRPPVGP